MYSVKTEIEMYIEQMEGTSIGNSVKNMYENDTPLESICDYLGWEYDSDDFELE